MSAGVSRAMLTVALALATAGCTDNPSDTKSTPSVSHTSEVAVSKGDAEQVATQVRVLETDPAALVAAASGVTADQARQAFPPGTEVEATPTTWSPDGTGVGGTIQIAVQPPSSTSVTYVAVMVKEAGAWKVLATIPVDAASTGTP
jgi:hypothetical protein